MVNSGENLGHYKDKIFWLIHLPILITCLLNSALIMEGDVTCQSLLREFSGRVKLNSSYIRYSPGLSFALEEKLVLSCIVYGLLKKNIQKNQVKTVKKVSCATE